MVKKIDPPYSIKLSKKRFLLYQERKTLIFATNFGLKILALSKNCLADETFKTASPPFYQVYTLFGSSIKWKIPIVWALLGEKTEEIYHKIFGFFAPETSRNFGNFFHARKYYLRLQDGVIQAIRKIFFVAQYSGCWFHNSQCILQKFQDFWLYTFYMHDQKIKRISKKFISVCSTCHLATEKENLGKIFDYLWNFGCWDQPQWKCGMFSIDQLTFEQTLARVGMLAGIKLWELLDQVFGKF